MSAPSQERTALVTGAGGFIGGHVARELLDHGWRVKALIRPESMAFRRWPEGCEVVAGDVLDRDGMIRAAEGVDAVFHVAARYSLRRGDADAVHMANINGTANAIAAARENGARLVHTSSVSTIGLRGDGPADEDTPLRPEHVIGAYKRSKVIAERLVMDAADRGVEAVIVNPSAPVGPGDWRPTPTGRVIRDALRGRMPAYVDTGLNLIDVRDVAAGHRLAFERGEPGRRYILANQDMTLAAILRLVAEIAGTKPPRVRLPHAVAIGVAAIDELIEGRLLRREPLAPLDGALMARHRMYYSPARAVRELGLPQSPVAAAVRDAVEWYRREDPTLTGVKAA